MCTHRECATYVFPKLVRLGEGKTPLLIYIFPLCIIAQTTQRESNAVLFVDFQHLPAHFFKLPACFSLPVPLLLFSFLCAHKFNAHFASHSFLPSIIQAAFFLTCTVWGRSSISGTDQDVESSGITYGGRRACFWSVLARLKTQKGESWGPPGQLQLHVAFLHVGANATGWIFARFKS